MGIAMDVTVKAAEDGATWQLTDLLGRSMGTISRRQDEFAIVPSGHALETMKAMKQGPFSSLDAALAEIEKHTRGTCRLEDSGPDAALPVDELDASNDK
jgi:hypothetical protein